MGLSALLYQTYRWNGATDQLDEAIVVVESADKADSSAILEIHFMALSWP